MKKLKNTEIIKKNYEFKYFLKKGKYYSGKLIEVFIFNSKNKKNKIGVAVSRKSGRSVVRNKIKRYIRAAYTDIENKIDINCNLLIIWKKGIDTTKASYIGIKEDLILILKNHGNIKEIE